MIYILVPFDFSQIATQALNFAIKLSDTCSKLYITIVHVVKISLIANAGTIEEELIPFRIIKNTPKNFIKSKTAPHRLNKFIHRFKFEQIQTDIYNSLSEEAGILEYADDISADLIEMATHGRTGILQLLRGSIAEDVINHSKRPVWTLKTSPQKI